MLFRSRFVNKGPGRPVFTARLRAEMLGALQCTTAVGINDSPGAEDVIRKIKPSVYVKGPDYKRESDDITGRIRSEREAVEDIERLRAVISACQGAGFRIAVESNGTLPATPGIDWLCISPKAGAPLKLAEIAGIDQTLDLWSGTLTSRFTLAGSPVNVVVAALPEPKGLMEVDATDHFFAGALDELEAAVATSMG